MPNTIKTFLIIWLKKSYWIYFLWFSLFDEEVINKFLSYFSFIHLFTNINIWIKILCLFYRLFFCTGYLVHNHIISTYKFYYLELFMLLTFSYFDYNFYILILCLYFYFWLYSSYPNNIFWILVILFHTYVVQICSLRPRENLAIFVTPNHKTLVACQKNFTLSLWHNNPWSYFECFILSPSSLHLYFSFGDNLVCWFSSK